MERFGSLDRLASPRIPQPADHDNLTMETHLAHRLAPRDWRAAVPPSTGSANPHRAWNRRLFFTSQT